MSLWLNNSYKTSYKKKKKSTEHTSYTTNENITSWKFSILIQSTDVGVLPFILMVVNKTLKMEMLYLMCGFLTWVYK